MSGIHIKKAEFSKLFNKEVKARVLVDFASTTPGQILNRSFDQALQSEVNNLIEQALPAMSETLKQHYKDSLDIVGNALSTGLEMHDEVDWGSDSVSVEFEPLSLSYYKRKLLERPATADKFWKFEGGMHTAYRRFAGGRKSGVSRSTAKFHLKSRGYKNRNRVYRYQIEFTLPQIRQDRNLDLIFRESYITANAHLYPTKNVLHGDGGTTLHGMEILAFNEALGHDRSRPFIVDVMATRGFGVRRLLVHQLQNKWKNLL